MKNVYILFLMIFTLLSCRPKELPTVMEINDERVTLKLSHQSLKSELEQYASKIAAMDFVMDFSSSEFFEDGKLRRLSLKVQCPDGSIGSTTADGVTLQFNYYGFEYYFTNHPVKFSIGVMDQKQE